MIDVPPTIICLQYIKYPIYFIRTLSHDREELYRIGFSGGSTVLSMSLIEVRKCSKKD